MTEKAPFSTIQGKSFLDVLAMGAGPDCNRQCPGAFWPQYTKQEKLQHKRDKLHLIAAS